MHARLSHIHTIRLPLPFQSVLLIAYTVSKITRRRRNLGTITGDSLVERLPMTGALPRLHIITTNTKPPITGILRGLTKNYNVILRQ